MSTTDIPRGDSGPRHIRLQADLVLEVTAARELRDAALARIDADTFMPREEREHARRAVGADESEALAYLVDPAELIAGLPGLDLVQASWSCAHTEYDPLTWADDAYDDTDEDDEDEDAYDDEDDDPDDV